MDKRMIRDTVNEVVCQVLEQTAFMFPEMPDPDEGMTFDGFEFVEARLSFSGDRSGEVMMIVPVDFCAELAENMLGEEIDEVDPESRSLDALKESLNIVAGQLLTRIFGDELIFNIGAPRAVELPQEKFFEIIGESEYACCVSDEYPIISLFNLEKSPNEHTSVGS